MDVQVDEEFAEFMFANWPALARLGYLLTGDSNRGLELASGALARGYAAWPRITKGGAPETYIRQIVVTRSSDRFRWRRGRAGRPALAGALDALPAEQRSALVLRHWLDLSDGEAAATLGCSARTVQSRVSKALARTGLRPDQAEPSLARLAAQMEVPRAPLPAAVRKGTSVRLRWRFAAVVACVAALAVIVPFAPQLTGRIAGRLLVSHTPRVTLFRLAPRAIGDVIAMGTMDGGDWRIRLTNQDEQICSTTKRWAEDCVEATGPILRERSHVSGPVVIDSVIPAFFGLVDSLVTRVSLHLSSGKVLSMRPVEAGGRRWVGVVIPSGLVPEEAIAYAGKNEIAYSVSFHDKDFGAEFLTWLTPGTSAPPARTKLIPVAGERRSQYVLRSGPWGICILNEIGGSCWPLGRPPHGVVFQTANVVSLPREVVMAYRAPASYLVLTMADGTTRKVPLVLAPGVGFAGMWLTGKPQVAHWDVYAKDGTRLSGGQGPPDTAYWAVRG